MKRAILIIILAVCSILQAATCSIDPNNPNILPGFTITAGQTLYWRARAIDPDYGIQGGYVDIVAGNNPAWVTFGPRIAPDANHYVFAPKNLDCDGNTVDPNTTFIASRRITIAPPKTVSGNFDIKFSTTDANQVSYWRIPFVVNRPTSVGVAGDAGLN